MKYTAFSLLFLITVILISGCSPFKTIKKDEVFLNSNKLNKIKTKLDTEESTMLKESISLIIKPKTNKKIFGVFRSRLFFYNIAYKEGMDSVKHHWFGSKLWYQLRKFSAYSLGEPPVVLDTNQITKNVKLMKSFLHKEGFFNAIVTDTVIYRRHHRLADIEYTVDGKEPFRIDSISYVITDSVLDILVRQDCEKSSIIKKGDIFDEDELRKERERLTHELQQRGYFYFSKEYLNYIVSVDSATHKINLVYGLKRINENKTAEAQNISPENHHSYKLKNIYIQTDYNPRNILMNQNLDTVLYKGVYFLSAPKSPKYSYDRLLQTVFFKRNEYFEIDKIEETNKRLGDLNYFKFINISLDSVHRDSLNDKFELNVHVQLSPSKRQSISLETEGTNQGSNKGIAVNADYRNKNTFSGFEMFDIKPKASVEEQITIISSTKNTKPFFNIFNTLEYGVEFSMNFQKLLFPGSLLPNISQHSNPKSVISTSYFQQIRPDYQRAISNVTFSENLVEPGSIFKKHNVNILDISYVNSVLDPAFQKLLNSYNDQAISNAYRPHITTDFNYSYTYKNQNINDKYRPYRYMFISGEVSGVLPTILYDKIQRLPRDDQGRKLLYGQAYSQYYKFDFDWRGYMPRLFSGNAAARVNISFGYPRIGQTQTLPFEKAYYGGGANDIRGWIARSLGPGSYINTQGIDQTGDIKLLLSQEYRFDLFWILQGAFFADEGNVWLWNKDPYRPNANFDWNRFYKEIAMGAGFGIRFNFNFFVIRFDEAWPLYDPSVPPNLRGFYPTKDLSLKKMRINIGIGFPF